MRGGGRMKMAKGVLQGPAELVTVPVCHVPFRLRGVNMAEEDVSE